jgi:hypothetical protein
MVGVEGSKAFNDYAIFLSGMAMVLRRLKDLDEELVIFSGGPKRIKDMALEFVNVSNFKSRGIKVKLVSVPESWFKNNFYKLEMFSFFCNSKESLPDLVNFLESKDVDVQIHRYHEIKQNKKDSIYYKE